MAITVAEIMNPELFSVRPGEKADDVLAYLMALGISGCPVIDQGGAPVGMVTLHDLLREPRAETVDQCMSSPVVSVDEEATIREAAHLLSDRGFHRLLVVDPRGRPVGIVSSVDIVRGLIGLPARHPAVFPHYDRTTGLSWTDDMLLDLDNVALAPDGPGVIALVTGGEGRRERIAWAEATNSIPSRLVDMLSSPQSHLPALERVLSQPDVRFRAASLPDADERAEIVAQLRNRVGRSAHP